MATAAKKKTEEERTDELLDAVAPPVRKRPQTIKASPDSPWAGFEKTYTQQKFSFFAKLEFVKIVAKAIQDTLDANTGLNFSQVTGVRKAEDLKQQENIVKAFLSIAQYAPDLITDTYMLALNVPAHEREIVKTIFNDPWDEETETGGLSDDDGLAVLDLFFDQNAKVMRDFFFERVPAILRKAQTTIFPDPDPTQG